MHLDNVENNTGAGFVNLDNYSLNLDEVSSVTSLSSLRSMNMDPSVFRENPTQNDRGGSKMPE